MAFSCFIGKSNNTFNYAVMECEYFQTKNFKEGPGCKDITTSIKVVSYGDKSSYQDQQQYCRQHLVIAKVSRETLSIQESVSCDYFRTPVIFWVPDIYRFVGGITGFIPGHVTAISCVVMKIRKAWSFYADPRSSYTL